MAEQRDFPSPACNLPTIGEGAKGTDVAIKQKQMGRKTPGRNRGNMSTQIKFSLIAPGHAQPLNCNEVSIAGIHGFIKRAICELKQGQWLLAEPSGDFPWELVTLLSDSPLLEEGFDIAARELAAALEDSTIAEEGLPQFDFQHTRLVFRHPTFQNPSSLGILGLLDGTPFLACEHNSDSCFGVVSMRDIASYAFFQDSTGAPISWFGGARLIQVNEGAALSFGIGDTESRPEAWTWHPSTGLEDLNPKILARWLQDHHLEYAFAWSTSSVGSQHDEDNQTILEEIAEGEHSGLALELDLSEEEIGLVREILSRDDEMVSMIGNMITVNDNELFRDLLISYGTSGMLFDGGRLMVEEYKALSSSRDLIQTYCVTPLGSEAEMPDLSRTRLLLSRIREIASREIPEEKLQELLDSDDQGLIVAGALLALESTELGQSNLLQRLERSFEIWEAWLDPESSPTLMVQLEKEFDDFADEV